MSKSKSSKQWPLRRVFIEWLRGPAWIDGDDIVMDRNRATLYHPFAEPEIGIELARVRTPQDAVAFVERFGLLRTRVRMPQDAVAYVKYLGLLRQQPVSIPPEEPLGPLRESFRSFESPAKELRGILEVARLVQRGAHGDAEALSRLRDQVLVAEDREIGIYDEASRDWVPRRMDDAYSPYERLVEADERTLLMYAHEHLVAAKLSKGITDSPACFHDRTFMGESVPPGALRFAVVAESLVSVCYLSVGLALADRMPVVCADPTCRRPFFPADKRQRFCSRACGNRVRFRRFTDKHGTATTSKEGN